MARVALAGLITLLWCSPAPLEGQAGRADGVGVRFRFASLPLRLPAHPALGPGGRLAPRASPAAVAARWAEETRRLADLVRYRQRTIRLASGFGLPEALPDSLAVALPLAPDSALQGLGGLQALARAADLTLELNARLETRVDRLRNLNCSAFDISNLSSGCQNTFPTPELGQQWQLRAGGVIADRLHLNVDFDTDREFSSSNTINLWYQGFEDEIVRRVEVGNLQFAMPESRFITSAIPANSFGIQADAQVGPLEFRTIMAQQKGSSVRTRVFTVGDLTTQTVGRESKELDFESGRFFFVLNPVELPQYPRVDVLNIVSQAIAPQVRPVRVRLYRLLAQTGQLGSNPNLGGITGVALRTDSPQRVGPFEWQLLSEGIDYYLDPSGVWFALRNRIGSDEYLAVSYVTAAGDTVGTFPSIDGVGDTLELIHEPRRGPEVPTFFYEMRNFYRIGGNDVSRNTVQLSLVVNDSDRPLSGEGTYLSLLNMALSTDPSGLDEFNRVFPRERDPNGGEPVRDRFVVFPNLVPFADSAKLRPSELNDSLYKTPDYLLASQGPASIYRFLWSYEASGSGDRSRLSLGAIQVRPESEQLFIGDRQLTRGRDYEILYDVGVVSFTNPDSLFTGPTEVRVRFEENQLFDDAPKNVVGFATTYNMGSRGRIDAVGIFQRERSVFTRPGLGLEPQGMLMGGLSGDFSFRAPWLTRALDGLPLLNTSVPSFLEINGEIAVTSPNPNRAGVAYIEEFEGESFRRIQLVQNLFQLGSRPLLGTGIPAKYLGINGEFDPADVTRLEWQNAIENNGMAFEIGPREIDSTIVLTGTSRQVETILWMTLKPDTVGGAPDPVTGRPRWILPHTPGPRWRTVSQSLDRSGLGVDLSRVEFLEFWVLEDFSLTAQRQETSLILDFGTVLEDALDIAPESLQVAAPGDTVFSGIQSVGEGVLDTEKDRVTNVFNAARDDDGIHSDLVPQITNIATGETLSDFPLCEQGFSTSVPVFSLGSLKARCTRLNGFLDTEDLNGDNRLDVNLGPPTEDLLRYVVEIGDPDLIVRDGQTLTDVANRVWTWRLYRIPFRIDSIQVGAPDIRQIRSLRITMTSPDVGLEEEVSLALARLRLIGAPWIKRAERPLVGIAGVQESQTGEVVVSTVSTENRDLGYESPPGVVNEPDRRGAELDFVRQEINERSLRIIASEVAQGERAEAFIRYGAEADKNFLQYQTLRVWARGRGTGWDDGQFEFFIKAGQDENNFYYYHTPAQSVTWEPEVLVNIPRWLTLRAEIENAFLSGEPPTGATLCGGDPLAYVRCDGPYLVHVRNPAISPPNLAQVSEVAVGMIRVGGGASAPVAELWVDDIRLSNVVSDAGFAGAVDARLIAADFAEVWAGISATDDRFRLIDEVPDYQADAVGRLGGTVRLDKLMPQRWGISMPVTAQYDRSFRDPFFLLRSDVRASAVPSLRQPRSSSILLEGALRRSRRGTTFAERLLLDPVGLSASYLEANNTSEYNSSVTKNRFGRFNYDNRPLPATIAGAPGFMVGLVDGLPGWIKESAFGRALRTSRLRLNPEQFRVASMLTNNETQRRTFRLPVTLDEEDDQVPLRGIVHSWRNELGIRFRPYSSFGFGANVITTRDLQDYGDSTVLGRLVDDSRSTLFGTDIGFLRDQILNTNISLSPVINSWLRPRASLVTEFVFHRNPNALVPVKDLDGTLSIPESFSNLRRSELGTTLDLARMASVITGAESPVSRFLKGLLPADVSYSRQLGSTYDRAPFSPDLKYALGGGTTQDFRVQRGVLATSAVDSDTWTAAGGLRLPLGFTVRATYRALEASTWALREQGQAEIVQRSTEWPSGFFSWVYTPRWGLRHVMTSLSAQAQYRRVETTAFQPGQLTGGGSATVPDPRSGIFAANDRRSVTPTLTVTWIGGVVTTAQYTKERGDALTSGNQTLSSRTGWGGTMTFSVRTPRRFVRLPSDLRTELAVNSLDVFMCLQRAELTDCSTISDSRRRQVDVRVDTAFPPNMRGGASFSYVLTDQRHTSSKFSQVILSVFLDINFLASQVR